MNNEEKIPANQLFFDFDDEGKIKIKEVLEDILILQTRSEIDDFLKSQHHILKNLSMKEFHALKTKYFPNVAIANTQVMLHGNNLVFILDMFDRAEFIFNNKDKDGNLTIYSDGQKVFLIKVHQDFLKEIQ